MLRQFCISLVRMVALILAASPVWAQDNGPKVKFETTMGDIVLQLDAKKAPATVDNFLKYVGSGFYDGTVFHRVIDDFMIQGGGYDESLKIKPTRPPIKNEANNGLKNARGTIAMARTFEPHSATAQFFINVTDNIALDYVSQTVRGWGYAVFGKVVSGMDVVDKIRRVKTGPGSPELVRDVPATPVVIKKASIVGD